MIQYANTDSWQTAFERVMGSGDGVGVGSVTMDDHRTSETVSGNAVDQESGLNAAGINRMSVSNILIDDIEMSD
ncbi:unnamed protein product [Anisakis simplex]|uniref:Synapsin_C domain-containing protein n=1 Tax=Anisakis simplex TaxID=6269 RepID=A0A0M3KED3_ANISI|nr:unnamed protein product [Anisakis simplex]